MPHSANKAEAAIIKRVAQLPFLAGRLTIEKIHGGLTNTNYKVSDAAASYLVRLGHDIVEHHVMRFNELAASYAAHQAGLSPAVVYSGDGVMALEFINARTLSAADVRGREILEKIIPLIRRCHTDAAKYLRGPALVFWVFHVLRDYSHTLFEANSPYVSMLAELGKIVERLEAAAGPFELVFAHNDLIAANLLDDGNRLWLIDWDYAGFNTPLFDLGGLASNNDFDQELERFLLENYYQTPLTPDLWHRYMAMKVASALREAMWSMVCEIRSGLDFDYQKYTEDNLGKFRAAHDAFLHT